MTLLDPLLVDEALEQGVSLDVLAEVQELNAQAAELNRRGVQLAAMTRKLRSARRLRGRRRAFPFAMEVAAKAGELEADLELWEGAKIELLDRVEREMGEHHG